MNRVTEARNRALGKEEAYALMVDAIGKCIAEGRLVDYLNEVGSKELARRMRLMSDEESARALEMDAAIAAGEERGRSVGIEIGLEKGFDLGKTEAVIGMAKSLKANNVPFKTISECSGLSLEEIARI